MRSIAATLCLCLCVSVASSEVTFTKPPTATAAADGVRVEFAVSAPTDVAVDVRDGQGRIVRHLAAGLLGPSAPPPLAKSALVQSLLWDRRDDARKPVPPGAYTVTVGLGLTPAFDRVLGYAENALGSIQSLAVGPGGELFVLNTASRHHAADSTPVCQVFSRDGVYLRTIMPYPSNLPDDRLAPFGRVKIGERIFPFVHHGENYCIYPGLKEPWRQGMLATPDGRLVFLSAPGRGGYHTPTLNRLFAIGTDGGAKGPVFGPVLARDGYGPVALALAPDGATFYASGVRSGFMNNPRTHHCVYRFSWPDEKAPPGSQKMGSDPLMSFRRGLTPFSETPAATPFIGRPFEPGKDENHLNDPRGVAVDGEGNIYVADRGNDRIAVFRADGSFLGAIDVEDPDFLAVSKRSGAVYVLGGRPAGALIKFSGWRSPRELARFELHGLFRDDRWTHGLVMALDDSEEKGVGRVFLRGMGGSKSLAAEDLRREKTLPTPFSGPVVWLGSPIGLHRFGLIRLEDRGTAFGEPREITDYGKMGSDPNEKTSRGQTPFFPGLHGSPGQLTVDRAREEVYASTMGRTYRFDGRTGDWSVVRTYGEGDLWVVGADGLVYAHQNIGSGKAVVSRWTRDFQPVPFANPSPFQGEGRVRVETAPLTPALSPEVRGGAGPATRPALPANMVPIAGTLHLKARGLAAARDGTIYVIQETRNHRLTRVNVIAPDGTTKAEGLVAALTGGASSVKVDNAGNVYVADCSRPKDWTFGGDPNLPPLPSREREGVRVETTAPLTLPSPRGGEGFDLLKSPLLPSGAVNWYPVIMGSVVKFPATGGGIFTEAKPGGTEVVVGYQTPRWRVGAEWQWAGMSPVPTFAGDAGQDHAIYCGCERGSFDVDDFGRSFVPDAARFSVHVLDTAGNELLRFGEYGNADAGAPPERSGKVPIADGRTLINPVFPSKAPIPLAWPISVGVSDEAAYVGDMVNRRIVRVRLTYRQSQSCPVEVK